VTFNAIPLVDGICQGFRVRMEASELSEHLQKRAAYWAGRAEQFQLELTQLDALLQLQSQASADAPATISAFNKGTLSNRGGMNPEDLRDDIQQRLTDSRNKKTYFIWLSQHLLSVVYVLSLDDLRVLEIAR
jgi:hypothetical protein